MVAIRDGKYAHVSLAETAKPPRRVQLDAYDTERFRPKYADRLGDPLLLTPVPRARRTEPRRSTGPATRRAAGGVPSASPPARTASGSRARGSTCPRRRSRGRRGPPPAGPRAPATGSVAPRPRASSRAITRSLRWSEVRKPERVVVVDHLAAAVLEDPARGRAAAAAPPATASGSRPGLHREDHPLGHAEVGRRR